MKRYLVGLSVLSAVMLLLAFAVKWMAIPLFVPVPMWMLPAAVIYFAVAYGVQYWLSVSSVNKHPKAFIQFFLATTVAVLFLHIVVLVGGMLANPAGGKRFAIAFLILYVVYTAYMTVALVRFMKNPQGN
ncbi:MAG: hypothetical protein IKP34_00955 [Bacteroidales bacterium]|jgi:hypothetical protein|nr:hypothetical protein [Bacteroidales bacterium]MBR4714728.1 hypothetical protein [Bacteroidales bacterium]